MRGNPNYKRADHKDQEPRHTMSYKEHLQKLAKKDKAYKVYLKKDNND